MTEQPIAWGWRNYAGQWCVAIQDGYPILIHGDITPDYNLMKREIPETAVHLVLQSDLDTAVWLHAELAWRLMLYRRETTNALTEVGLTTLAPLNIAPDCDYLASAIRHDRELLQERVDIALWLHAEAKWQRDEMIDQAWEESSPSAMTTALPDPSSAEALRYAAEVMKACEERHGRWLSYSKSDMLRAAEEVEAGSDDDREMRHLARVIAADPDLAGSYADNGAAYWKVARSIMDAGWTRGDRLG